MRLLSVVGAALALLVLGCSSGEQVVTDPGENETPGTGLASAVEQTMAMTGSMRMEAKVTLVESWGTSSIQVSGSGAFAGEDFEMTVSFEEAEGSDWLVPGEEGSSSETVRFVGGVGYTRSGEGPWSGLESRPGVAADNDAVWSNLNDPVGLLVALKEEAVDVTQTGVENLDGEQVIHYVADLEPAVRVGYVEGMSPSEVALLEAMANQEGSRTVDVWVGADDGLIRRIRDVTEATPVQDVCGYIDIPGGYGEAVLDFFDYGAPVEIEVPDPETVVAEAVPEEPPENTQDLGSIPDGFAETLGQCPPEGEDPGG